MTDILSYMLPDEAWALENHLETSGAAPLPLYTVVSGKMLWDIKGAGGFPWDGNSFDEQYVYQSITENVWTNASSFKMFASKTWPNGNGGIVWAPRYFTPGDLNSPIVTADCTYRTYSACGTFATSNLGGAVSTQIEGPYNIDFGESLGTQSALVQKYFWGSNLEVNYYVIGFGHVQWQLYTLTGGVYILQQTSAFNLEVAGGTPPLVFPCGVPMI
jgi:hypothetical protein